MGICYEISKLTPFVQTPFAWPYLCQVPSISNWTFCWLFITFGVGFLYKELSSEREFRVYGRWRRHSVVMICDVKFCHILEVKNAYAEWRISPLAVLLPGQAARADLLTSSFPSALRAARPRVRSRQKINFLAHSQNSKANISFVMSARLSVRMRQIGSHCTYFH
jgi:hypothetical protein